jgi:ribosomal-protein-alanine N-acetyltransferase
MTAVPPSRMVEAGPVEVGPVEVGPVEVGPVEVGPVEVGGAHAEALAAVHAAAFRAPDAWPEAVLAAQIAQPGSFALLDPAGGMVLARVAADEAEILTLAVAPSARRRGVAFGLIAAAKHRAAAAGAVAMFLEVASDNEAARALYAKAGFRRVGRRARYYPNGGDALVLRADLTARDAAEDG